MATIAKKSAVVCSFLARGLLPMVKLKLTYKAAVVKNESKVKVCGEETVYVIDLC